MEKFFNTAGPVNQPEHYKVDPLHRWDLDEVLTLIAQRKYFILHAPRQTGKTSSILALAEYLNAGTEYHAVYANIEAAQAARHDVEMGIGAVLQEIHQRLEGHGLARIDLNVAEYLGRHSAGNSLSAYLTETCAQLDRALVLFIDEIDALIGDTLVSVLRQLRSGYDKRPAAFPSTVVLCGVRDIKDYRIHKSDAQIITGGSAFNIKAKSLRLGNFTLQDVRVLYEEHTKSTGQRFDEACFDVIWRLTAGQPWLVNALAHEVTFEMKENRDRSRTITTAAIEEAKERLILSRQTHLDQLADKLSEERVRRVILPMILGEPARALPDDEQYCIDLGLIRLDRGRLDIANEIYREVIPRELTESQQRNFHSRFSPAWVANDGSLDVRTMMAMFQDFWRENSAIWASHISGYQEAAPHLVTQAFLQRVANGQGQILREYAVGRGRTDLMLMWPYQSAGTRVIQRIVLELKVYRSAGRRERVLDEGLSQTAAYARRCGTQEAHLLLFDRTAGSGRNPSDGVEVDRYEIPDPDDLPPLVPPESQERDGVTVTVWWL